MAISASAQIVVNFDHSADLSTFESSYSQVEYGWSPSGGLNGSGSLTSAGSDKTYFTNTGTVLPSLGEEIGVYFQYQGDIGTPSDLRLGFVGTTSSPNPNPDLDHSFFAEFANNGITIFTSNQYLGSNSFSGVTMTNGDWYYAQFSILNEQVLSAPLVRYGLTANLYQADSSGTIGSLLSSESTQASTVTFQPGASLNGFIGSMNPNKEFSHLDNLTVQAVPEPSALLLILIGGCILIAAKTVRISRITGAS